MNRKRGNINSPESKEKCMKVDHTQPTNSKYLKFDKSPTTIPTQLSTINVCAFNHQNTLLLVTGCKIGMSYPNHFIRQIYTIEGYLVTSLNPDYHFLAKSFNMLAFCEHFILYAEFIPQTSMYFEGECAFNCGILEVTHDNEYNFRTERYLFLISSHLYLESDKKGNIYLNGAEGNLIAVFDSWLEFTGNISFNCIEKGSDIITIGIHNDYLVVLKYLNGGHWIHRFCLSTLEHIETVKIENPEECYPHRLSFHDYDYIMIYNASIRSISVWHYEGPTQHFMLPLTDWIKDDNKTHSNVKLAIMNNQLIGVIQQGYIIIYNII